MIGIIGGSGVYDLPGLQNRLWRRVGSPFGSPSDELLFGDLAGDPVVFLPRHGRGHAMPPSAVNYRANIDALKRAGVTDIIAVSSVGSLREELPPGTLVLVDQYIDRTQGREKSFFGPGCVAHVSLARPTCDRLSTLVAAAAQSSGISMVRGGTYLAMEGPQFSTRAESEMYRSLQCDVIGMTNMPEARLAREAEMCYASIAMVTDYDCWHPDHDAVTVEMIINTVRQNSARAQQLVSCAIGPVSGDASARDCGCRHALDNAFLTRPEHMRSDVLERLDAVARRVLPPRAPAGEDIRALIRTIPDFPKPGIQFRDIMPLLEDPSGLDLVTKRLAEVCREIGITKIAAIEARGFLFGAPLARELGVGMVALRKPGKLPGKTMSQSYQLEYGVDSIELHHGAMRAGDRVFLVDDLIATGGTATAALQLIRRTGADVAACGFVIDLPDLGGAEKLRAEGVKVFALCQFDGH